MSSDSKPILYHYNASPYGQRIVYYLTLRGIPYSECMQPATLPRPDLSKNLNISYRRIPLLALNNSVYADTRLILRTLNNHYPPTSTPHSILHPLPTSSHALTSLLSTTIIAGEIFPRAAQLIPLTSPIYSNPHFLQDRTQFTGREWNLAAARKARPEALVVMRNFFADLESDFLADGRDWILGTPGPTMADIEAVWIPAWLMGMKDALPAEVIGEEIFPRVWAYVHRFLGVVAEAKKMMGKMERIDGGIAAKRILSAENAGSDADGFVVEENDPLGLKAGQQVSVWPLDSGFSHKDQGKLVGLGWHEIVIEKDVDGAAGRGIVRLHFPRTGFRVMPVEAGKARL